MSSLEKSGHRTMKATGYWMTDNWAPPFLTIHSVFYLCSEVTFEINQFTVTN